MRAATITAVVAIPMLLVYAFIQTHVVIEALAVPATMLAGFLAVAAALSASGRALGGLLLAIGALARRLAA